jgi:streptomycin 6-kinase
VTDQTTDLNRLLESWELALDSELPGSTCSSVFVCHDLAGREVVLKIPEPHAEEKESIETLRAFSKVGGVAILAHDSLTGAVLMPRLIPGTSLGASGLSDDEAAVVCAQKILELRSAPSVKNAFRLEDLFSNMEALPSSALADIAREVSEKLFRTTQETVLLHGDLHHYNILLHGAEWIVIDPKGVMGDRSFEVAAFIRNIRTPQVTTDGCRHYLLRFHELLGDPIERLWGWSFAQTVLCSISAPPDGRWRGIAERLMELEPEFGRF